MFVVKSHSLATNVVKNLWPPENFWSTIEVNIAMLRNPTFIFVTIVRNLFHNQETFSNITGFTLGKRHLRAVSVIKVSETWETWRGTRKVTPVLKKRQPKSRTKEFCRSKSNHKTVLSVIKYLKMPTLLHIVWPIQDLQICGKIVLFDKYLMMTKLHVNIYTRVFSS